MYLRIPQDHMISGDAYTRCYDDIPNVPSKSKVIHDLLSCDFDTETTFYHAFECLYLCKAS